MIREIETNPKKNAAIMGADVRYFNKYCISVSPENLDNC
jgi:hypothetical protein